MLSRRTMEIATAAALGVYAAAVIAGSLQLDTGWAATGPQAGYVPLRLGAMLLVVSALLVVQAVRQGAGDSFATREQLHRSLSLFLPTIVLAVAMAFLGVYLSGAVYLAYMARRHGGLGWGRAVALGVVSTVLFFLTFEIWFGVPLAKGPIEHWLGY
ncbi:MAG: tripartite tricarboxylate transporter TctB family protein [Pseudomonadota bacterium]